MPWPRSKPAGFRAFDIRPEDGPFRPVHGAAEATGALWTCCLAPHCIEASHRSADIDPMDGGETILGYRLTARRHDRLAPGGSLQVDWIALATSAIQADGVLRAEIGAGWDITLVAVGPSIMDEAQARGLLIGCVARL